MESFILYYAPYFVRDNNWDIHLRFDPYLDESIQPRRGGYFWGGFENAKYDQKDPPNYYDTVDWKPIPLVWYIPVVTHTMGHNKIFRD